MFSAASSPLGDKSSLFAFRLSAVLRRRKLQVAIVFSLVVAVVAACAFLMPRPYTAQMKVRVENNVAATADLAASNRGPASTGEVTSAQIDAEIAVLRSSRLQHDLRVSRVRRTNTILVEYSAPEPRQSAAVLVKLAESYIQDFRALSETPGTYQFFNTRAAALRRDLSEIDLKLTELRANEDFETTIQRKEATARQVSDLATELTRADAAIAEAAAHIADTRDRLASIARRIAGAGQPADLALSRQKLEADLETQQAGLTELQARRQSLARQSWICRQQLIPLALATAAYDDLVRTRQEAENNYRLFAAQAEQVRASRALGPQRIVKVSIAEAPVVPHAPSLPHLPLILALAVLLAGLLSLGAACVEYRNAKTSPDAPTVLAEETVTDAADLEALTGVPVLAHAHRDA
jgi:uncharacterized protein involved in exopolysaccharide biosynthesis